jgi:hypothetical protein
MGGIARIAIIIIALWVAVEAYTEGLDGAFGGMFASAVTNPLEHTASAPQRARVATERALQETDERRRRMLGE